MYLGKYSSTYQKRAADDSQLVPTEKVKEERPRESKEKRKGVYSQVGPVCFNFYIWVSS